MIEYISREAAIRVIDELYVKRPLDSDRFVLTGVGARLEELPAADVRENVHAHWIHWKNWGDRFVCSNCSKEMTESQIGAFCKECGAVMDGGDEK